MVTNMIFYDSHSGIPRSFINKNPDHQVKIKPTSTYELMAFQGILI